MNVVILAIAFEPLKGDTQPDLIPWSVEPPAGPHRFGPFELDPMTRELRLNGEPLVVQPRVFDLLAYLVGNAGRVVPKDELMDVLWPKVIVTESSLQRAASLARQALAAGGLERAIRNFARRGYRFMIDETIGWSGSKSREQPDPQG